MEENGRLQAFLFCADLADGAGKFFRAVFYIGSFLYNRLYSIGVTEVSLRNMTENFPWFSYPTLLAISSMLCLL